MSPNEVSWLIVAVSIFVLVMGIIWNDHRNHKLDEKALESELRSGNMESLETLVKRAVNEAFDYAGEDIRCGDPVCERTPEWSHRTMVKTFEGRPMEDLSKGDLFCRYYNMTNEVRYLERELELVRADYEVAKNQLHSLDGVAKENRQLEGKLDSLRKRVDLAIAELKVYANQGEIDELAISALTILQESRHV